MRKRVGKPNGKGKGGRRCVEYVTHPDTGKMIVGLRIHRPTATFYRIAADKKSRHYYKKNGRVGLAYQRRAIYEHECWQAGCEPSNVVLVRSTVPAYDEFGTQLPTIATHDDNGLAVNATFIGREDLAVLVREQLGNPATRGEFADLVGIPELRNLTSLKPVAKPLQPTALLAEYTAGNTFAHKRQYSDAKRTWERFVETVKVDTVDEISNDHLLAYKSNLQSLPALRSRRNAASIVQDILSFAYAIHPEHGLVINNLKTQFRLIVQKGSKDKKRKAMLNIPRPLKYADWRKLMDHVKAESPKWYAFLMCMTNFAMHGTECCGLTWDEMDLQTGELTSIRTKTGVPRVAVIWKETIAALRVFKESDEYHEDELVFLNDKKGELNIDTVGDHFQTWRKALGIKDLVSDSIRDTTRKAMGAKDRTATAWVMGHSLGEDDKYAVRDPAETATVLEKARKSILGACTNETGS